LHEARNTEVARVGYAAWARGDFEGAVALFAPDFVFEEDPAFPEAAVYHGPEEFMAYARSFLDMWAGFELTIEEIVARGDRVLGMVRWTLVGKESGVPVELPIAHLWTMRGGRAVHMRGYVDRAEARSALGLD
jgi:hypothetical protein